jgi:hypothetical protein
VAPHHPLVIDHGQTHPDRRALLHSMRHALAQVLLHRPQIARRNALGSLRR